MEREQLSSNYITNHFDGKRLFECTIDNFHKNMRECLFTWYTKHDISDENILRFEERIDLKIHKCIICRQSQPIQNEIVCICNYCVKSCTTNDFSLGFIVLKIGHKGCKDQNHFHMYYSTNGCSYSTMYHKKLITIDRCFVNEVGESKHFKWIDIANRDAHPFNICDDIMNNCSKLSNRFYNTTIIIFLCAHLDKEHHLNILILDNVRHILNLIYKN